jgi:NAD(P)H dehydrogenase (quinone)
MIVVTGASGQLGRLVIESLLKHRPAGEVIAAVRDPAKVQDLASRGVQVRRGDYNRPETLPVAFQGATRVLLISGSEVGKRVAQHQAVIDAAKRAGINLFAYTSILRGDKSPLPLAEEHKETERRIKDSGLPWVLLRNGWYIENHVRGIPTALQFGAIMGCAGDGRFSSAARADYAEAAAAVLTGPSQAERVLELAGDTAFTLSDLAAEISKHSGKTVTYHNMPEASYKEALVGAGLPEPLAAMLATCDTGAAQGGLFDDGRRLSHLIGRPTSTMPALVKAALAGGSSKDG